jgi:hypothetical protein
MPRNHKGIGTIFYGRTDEHADGSFVTVEWFILLGLPILPLRCFRITTDSRYTTLWGFGRFNYSIVERLTMAWPQVVKTYALAWGLLAWSLLIVAKYDEISSMVGPSYDFAVVFGLILAPFVVALVPAWLRRRKEPNQTLQPTPPSRRG